MRSAQLPLPLSAGDPLARSWPGIRAARPAVAPDERYRGERVLAIARACLAVLVAAAALLEPALTPGASAFLPQLLVGYAAASAALLVLLLFKPARPSLAIGVHVVDVSVAAAVLLFAEPRMPASMLALFGLLAAAHRWGLRGTLMTAAATIAPLLAGAALAGLMPQSLVLWQLAGTVGLRHLVVGSALLVLGGVVLAYMTQAERELRLEAAAIGAVFSRMHLRTGLKNAMAIVFDAVTNLVGARRALLVVHEIRTGRVSLWEGGRLVGAMPSIHVTPMEPYTLDHYMFAPDAAAWLATRHRSHAERVDIFAVDGDGERYPEMPSELPDIVLATVGDFQSLMAIGFEIPGELVGRLLLVDPRADYDAETTLARAQRVVRQLTPAVQSLYVLHTVRSRSAASERARVARELHDGIIQGVLGVEVQLHALSVPAAKTSQALATELTRLGHLLRGETARLRDMMQGLTPRELPPAQLMGTIAEIVQRFQLDTGITARFITPVDRLALAPRGCRELTRIVQEALVNVRKHSGARNVVVRLTPADGVCQLAIDDDGQGFPYAGRRSLDLEQAHLSLWSIRERVRVLGGQVIVESNPGRGAKVEITFPIANHATH